MSSLISSIGYYTGLTSIGYYAYVNVNDYMQCETKENDMTQIAKNLFVCNYETTCNKNALRDTDITHIVNCVYGLPNRYPDDFIYKNIPLLDNENEDIMPYIAETNQFIDDAIKNFKGNVLVHCMYGASRSVSLLAAYIIYKGKGQVDVKGALDFIKDKRGKINPNIGYISQLEKYYEVVCQLNQNK